MNLIIEKFTKAFNNYSAEQFIDAFFESIIISLIITFFLWLRKSFIHKHKLIPINASTVDMIKVMPTGMEIGSITTGFDTKLTLRIQNIGNKPAEDLRIIYILKHGPPLSFGLNYFDRNMQHLYPGDVSDFFFKNVINIENAHQLGSHSFKMNVLLVCKKGGMTYFDIAIFKNFGHESIQSVSISNIQSQNRFKSFLIRKFAKNYDKKGVKKLLKLLCIKDEFINGYKLLS